MKDDMTNTPTLMHRRWSRRGFLAAGAFAGAGVALASEATYSFAQQPAGAAGDLAIARVAASLEVLAVSAYQATLTAAGENKLGAVPPAVATYVQTALGNHQFALQQWNAVITGAGMSAVNAPPADLNATVQAAFGRVTDVKGAAELALLLEQTAADTYFMAIPKLTIPAAIDLAGNLQIIDQKHAAILLFVLGRYPVPETFMSGAKAYSPPAAAAPQPAAAAVPAAKPSGAPAAAQPVVQPAAQPRTGTSGIGATTVVYTVQDGDTIGSISTAVYGDASHVGDIIESNYDILSRPDGLTTGTVLVLPLVDTDSRTP